MSGFIANIIHIAYICKVELLGGRALGRGLRVSKWK